MNNNLVSCINHLNHLHHVHHITTHDATGKAVFSHASGTWESHQVPSGSIQVVASTHNTPLDLSSEADIEQYKIDRTQSLFLSSRVITPDKGTSALVTVLNPGEEWPIHRTMTFDVVYMLEGVVELHLDSGEKRVVQAGRLGHPEGGRSISGVNVTPDGGVAKWIVFAQAAGDVGYAGGGGKSLSNEWD
ncbi:cupin domain-containing protein [Colletotrichum salicis]|uniref:Cupin domain-containing protein n=1 Tax=Colletotrichum salicis TaxID=1209931 RepID=A0A135V8M4_9PEZI|nr:cupin domain-containing protein [Colletotrichum salicis]